MQSWQTGAPGAPLARVDSPNPVPEGTQVLLRTVACGVCHSDLHLQEGVFELGGGRQLQVGREGQVLGHEIFGEVVALGPQAEDVVVGERRVVYPWIGCGACPVCRRGDEHLCTPGQALGIVNPGGFADHVLVPHSRYLFDKGDVPDALAGAWACSGLTAWAALKKMGEPRAEDEIVIIGAGGVGMMAIQIARARGMNPIVVDIDPAKLAAARELADCRTFDSSDPDSARALRKATGGAFAVLDLVGSEASVSFGLACLRKGGMLIVVGLYGGALTIPIPFLPMNARIIQGSYVGTLEDMGELMAMVRAGRIAPIPINERPFSQVNQALAELKEGKVRGRLVLINNA